MSFGAGLLTGVADSLTAKRDRAERERALSVLEAASQVRQQPALSVPQSGGAADSGQAAASYDAGGWDASTVDPAIASGILESAAELGMDPEDLATMVSYETAGTFDPTKPGPTTKWGQHKGLIQFGEPQAKQYGVDWNNPVGSQLGRNGAVVAYFRDRGWQPGMGMLDAYSIINAGSPGRYNASDAGNGGAPGTVRDKVMTQMDAHRAKAKALLAKYGTAPASSTSTDKVSAPGEWFTGFFRE